jgi:hypothetical protein
MAYSKWNNSYWYTFWSGNSAKTKFKWPTKKLKRDQVFEICEMRPFFITYGELEDEGMGRIISKVKKVFRKINPNKPPNEEDIRELMNYINTWREDVDRHFKFSTFMLFEWYYPIRNKINRLWKKH